MQQHLLRSLCLLVLVAKVVETKPQYECHGSCPGSCYPTCTPQCCAGAPTSPPVLNPPPANIQPASNPVANAQVSGLFHRPLSLSEVDKISERTAVGCEEDKLLLKCKNKFDKMAILSTFYGRDDSVTCFSNVIDSSSKCEQHADFVSKKVQDLCTSENRCKIPVTADFLAKNGEENCPGVRKYLKVIYRCAQHPQILQTCPNSCRSACWPLCARDCCSPPPPPPPPPVHFPTVMTPPAMPQPYPSQLRQALMPAPPQAPLQPIVAQPPPVAMAAAPPQITMPAQRTAMTGSVRGTCNPQCNPACAPLCLPACCNAMYSGISSPSIGLAPVPPVQRSNYQMNAPVQLPAPQVAPRYGCPTVCLTSCQPGCPPACCTGRAMSQGGLFRSGVPSNARAIAAMSGGYRSQYGITSKGNYRSRVLSQRRKYNPGAYYPQSNAFPDNAMARSQIYSQYARYHNRAR